MKLVFNDAQTISIQSAEREESLVKIGLIGMERTEILGLFQNEDKTKRFSVMEDGNTEVYEGYTWEALTERTGAIYEVTMVAREGTTKERLTALEQSTEDLMLMMAEMIGGGEV